MSILTSPWPRSIRLVGRESCPTSALLLRFISAKRGLVRYTCRGPQFSDYFSAKNMRGEALTWENAPQTTSGPTGPDQGFHEAPDGLYTIGTFPTRARSKSYMVQDRPVERRRS